MKFFPTLNSLKTLCRRSFAPVNISLQKNNFQGYAWYFVGLRVSVVLFPFTFYTALFFCLLTFIARVLIRVPKIFEIDFNKVLPITVEPYNQIPVMYGLG
jgi:hypothetical protein